MTKDWKRYSKDSPAIQVHLYTFQGNPADGERHRFCKTWNVVLVSAIFSSYQVIAILQTYQESL